MGLVIKGKVSAVIPTKGGNWQRVIVPSSGRLNDLVMFPITEKIAEGDLIEANVRAQVETTSDGRPMKQIVYWLDTPRAPSKPAPAAG